ncbi:MULTISPECIES: hypothetical protein [Francisella]|uniref:Uncharacterized protein n=1 Tax=Francisella marina TaxID=2249302 RepID=A0ABX5ZDW2_9GAMM|nr:MULTISPECIES: hypothetical protein [Francisella]QEO56428.1 hypothetical protein F0R74_00680 [Francisella marina]QEO59455.1 hypothetical protein F0R75_06550 [Francisella marina]
MNQESLNQEPNSANKICTYRNVFSCICLIAILAIFFITELAILVGIFFVFATFYVAIAGCVVAYLIWLGALRLSKYLKEKK